MQEYEVLRQHLGDKEYAQGDIRTANPRDVAHLVKNGVLRLKAAPEVKNKAVRAPRNKKA